MKCFSPCSVSKSKYTNYWYIQQGAAAAYSSSHRSDHLCHLLDDFADLVLGDDQRRRQGQGVAGDAEHQIVVVEGAVEAVEAALARRVRAGREVDAGGQADRADVHHI